MGTPLELIGAMYEGAVRATQGFGQTLNAAFQSVLRGVTLGETGTVTYGSTYTELAQFAATFAGIGLAAGLCWVFIGWIRRRRRG